MGSYFQPPKLPVGMREGPLDCVAAPGSFWGQSTHCGDEIWGQLAPTVWPPPVARASGQS